MASESRPSQRALTCKLPLKKGVSFLRFSLPDWSRLDIIGQTILLKELAASYDSFQKACMALSLHDCEVESFLDTHLDSRREVDQGAILAARWGQDQEEAADDNADIPQQRPLLVTATSIQPACDYLKALGDHDHVPAVQSWTGRLVTWPPYINVSDLNLLKLTPAVIDFPIPQKPPGTTHSRLPRSLDDCRPMVSLVGDSEPNSDGAPDAHLRFIDLPAGSIAYGPGGPLRLPDAGRYYVGESIDYVDKGRYSELILARDGQEDREGGRNQQEDVDFSQGLAPETELFENLTVDPKDIFAPPLDYETDSEDDDQEPSAETTDPDLDRLSSTWPGQIFQFRMPPHYTLTGPTGGSLTFDPPQYNLMDTMGNLRGIGGTYHIVPSLTIPSPTFNLEELPPHVAFRLKMPEKMIVFRNGTALPRVAKPGVHEWSTREGVLDFYSSCSRGRYNVFEVELPGNEIEEALEILAPHREWLDSEHAEEKRLDKVAAELEKLKEQNKRREDNRLRLRVRKDDAKKARELQEAQKKAEVDAIATSRNTATLHDGRELRGRRNTVQKPSNLDGTELSDTEPEETQQQEKTPAGSTVGVKRNAMGSNKAPAKRGRPSGPAKPKLRPDSGDEDWDEDECIPSTKPPRRPQTKNRRPASKKVLPVPVVNAPATVNTPVPPPTAWKTSQKRGATPRAAQAEKPGVKSTPAGPVMQQWPATASGPTRAPSMQPRYHAGPPREATKAVPAPKGNGATVQKLPEVAQWKCQGVTTGLAANNDASGTTETTRRSLTPKPSVATEMAKPTGPELNMPVKGSFTTGFFKYFPR